MNRDQRKKTRQLLLATYLLSSGGEAKDEDDLREHLPPYDEIYRGSAGEENDEARARDTLGHRLAQDVEDLTRIGIRIEVERARDRDQEEGRERRVYRLPAGNFSPVALDLDEDERDVLVSAVHALNQGFPYSAPLRLALANLIGAATFDPRARDDGAAFAAALSASRDEAASKRVGQLDKAISRRKRVRFDYGSISGGETFTREMEPYLLSLLGDAWYVTGRDTTEDAVRQLNVSRIAGKVTLATKRDAGDFERPESLAELYTAPRAPWQLGELTDTARISVYGEAAHRLQRSYRWSGDFGRDRDRRTFTTRYSDERALAEWLLSLGDVTVVLSPRPLAERVADGLRKLVADHGEARS